MEPLAKIELIGIVGQTHETIVGNERIVRFSVAVNTAYRGAAGATVQVSWFNCVYWGNCTIEKGQQIHLEGRVRSQSYTDQDGNARQYMEVKVGRIW